MMPCSSWRDSGVGRQTKACSPAPLQSIWNQSCCEQAPAGLSSSLEQEPPWLPPSKQEELPIW